MILDDLEKKGLINPPPFVISNCSYATVMGSHAYGCADTSVKSSMPDMDIYGFCIPRKEMLFPHLSGEIPGFGTPGPRFDQWQKAHIFDPDAHGGHGQEYDFQIFNIVKFFELARQGNPNIMDALFTREECVLHCTSIGRMVRDNRKLFVSKTVWPRMRGYAYSQMHKMKDKNFDGAKTLAKILEFEEIHGIDHKTSFETLQRAIKDQGDGGVLQSLDASQLRAYQNLYELGMNESKRFEIHKFHGYDCKFGYHILRLLDQCEQLLLHGEMDLQRAKEAMKSIRRGDWSMDDIIDWASRKEKELDVAFTNSKLPDQPDEKKLKKILQHCLEEHYGTMKDAVQYAGWAEDALRDIDKTLGEIRQKLYR